MLEHVQADIFDSPAQTLVNAVNTGGVMGKGIAAEFKRRFPAMFVRYQQRCRDGLLRIGTLDLHSDSTPWVLNFPTKQHWRSPSRLEWVEAGLVEFVATHEQLGISSIAFPRLGCGLGGLAWAEVEPLMARYLSPLPIAITVHSWEPHP